MTNSAPYFAKNDEIKILVSVPPVLSRAQATVTIERMFMIPGFSHQDLSTGALSQTS